MEIIQSCDHCGDIGPGRIETPAADARCAGLPGHHTTIRDTKALFEDVAGTALGHHAAAAVDRSYDFIEKAAGMLLPDLKRMAHATTKARRLHHVEERLTNTCHPGKAVAVHDH